MTIYNINRGIGWASSGVEYAQAYRAGIFRELGFDAKFIFTDMFQAENLAHFTDNIGFKDSEIIWLYSFFTDLKIAPTTYSLERFESTLPEGFEKVEHNQQMVCYRKKEQDFKVLAFFRKDHPDYVQRVEYLSKGKLIRKDYFSYTKIFSEYYVLKDDKPHLSNRLFFNEDGSVAYEENCDGEQSVFRFADTFLYSKEELIGRMLDLLELTDQDIILMDRSTGTGQAILRHKGKAKVAVVIHAEHYNANHQTEHSILWNNYYEYQFTNADKIDAFISSTEEQTQTLARQLSHYTKHSPKLFTIPVGSLEELKGLEGGRRAYSLITCSRLASEKHIDWLVQAVIQAKASLPELTFDIYGEGGQRSKLQEMIELAGAQDYIRLMGHHDLSNVYQNYQAYLTASTSEGFGLTLMEAIGSGLPLIGLDVPYGNQTFVKEGKNGYLIPRQLPDDALSYAKQFADKICQLFSTENLDSYHQASYQRAKDFLKQELELTWTRFVKELTSDSTL